MWLDDNLVLCDNTGFFGTAGTNNLIGNVIDLGQFDTGKPKLSGGVPAADYLTSNPNFGGVMPMTLLFRSTESPTDGATTFNFKLYSDDALSGSSIAAAANLHWQTGVLAYTTLEVGREMIVPIPWDNAQPVQRYMQLAVDRVGTSTDGKISAMLIVGAQQWEAMHGNYVQV